MVPFCRIRLDHTPQLPVTVRQVTLFSGANTLLGVKLVGVVTHSLLWRYRPMMVYSVSCRKPSWGTNTDARGLQDS